MPTHSLIIYSVIITYISLVRPTIYYQFMILNQLSFSACPLSSASLSDLLSVSLSLELSAEILRLRFS
jgi:hypothetical protein